MPVKFSPTWDAVRKRIQRLPKLVENMAEASRKRDANDLIAYWRSGLLNGTFRLAPLKEWTVRRKAKLGYSIPENPLYGLGLEGAFTYIKGMRVFKTKAGYVVRMVGRHHKSKLSRAALFDVHENGAVINSRGRSIIIPARPAMAMAYQMLMREIVKRDDNRQVQLAAMEFLLKGSSPRAEKALMVARASEARNV